MALVDTITAFLRRLTGAQGETPARTTASEVANRPQPISATVSKFRVESGRRAEVEDGRTMYKEDDRVKGILQTVARDAVKGGFQVKVKSGADPARAQEVADALVKRLKLFSRLDDWVRLTLRDGDTFLENVVDARMDVVNVTRKPTLGMRRNSNRQDTFDDPTRAYWYSDRPWAIGGEAPLDAIWFADWQVIHARWDHDEGSRYGTPLFSSARKPYKRMTEGELDVALRRKTRAGMKYAHQFPPGTSKDDIESYMERNKAAVNDPFAAVLDYFGTAEVKVVQGDARLSEIDDVVHHIRTFWVASPVPMSLLGYGQDLNRDVLEEQKKQYDRALETITQWVEDELVVPLLELQWLLQGIWPDGIEYEIVWVSKQVITPADIKDIAEAVSKLKAAALLPDDQLLQVLAAVIPTIDVDAALAFIRDSQADEIDRIAAAAAQRTGRVPAPEEGDEEAAGLAAAEAGRPRLSRGLPL